MTSRLTSEDFIPSCPIAMPSVTVIVVNSRGVPPAADTPFFAACAWRDSAMLHGAASFGVVAAAPIVLLLCSSVSRLRGGTLRWRASPHPSLAYRLRQGQLSIAWWRALSVVG